MPCNSICWWRAQLQPCTQLPTPPNPNFSPTLPSPHSCSHLPDDEDALVQLVGACPQSAMAAPVLRVGKGGQGVRRVQVKVWRQVWGQAQGRC